MNCRARFRSSKKLAESKKNNGFTLIETVIAVTILATVIGAASGLLISLSSANRLTLQVLQAEMLAREGIEAVRNMRDSNWLQNQEWNRGESFWGESFNREGDYIVELVFRGMSPWQLQRAYLPTEEEKTALFAEELPNGGVRYTHRNTGNTRTGFSRVIHITPSGDSDALRVESRVSYGTKEKQRSLSLFTELTNWK